MVGGLRGAISLIKLLTLKPARAAMSCSEIIFTTVGGLRGAISLILVQQVVTESSPGQEDQKVTAEVRPQGFAHGKGPNFSTNRGPSRVRAF